MNHKIRNIQKTLLSDNWYTLNKFSFEYQNQHGQWQLQHREAYDRGNGATILLYNKAKGTVILTRQFRMPTYINGNPDGLLIETCAGLLEQDNPEDCIKREAEEETGYKVDQVQKLFEAYMSPGSVTEIIHFLPLNMRRICRSRQAAVWRMSRKISKYWSWILNGLIR